MYNKRLVILDVYFKANFDGTKIPYNTTKDYKSFAIRCKDMIQSNHCPINFDDYTSKKDAYQAFNKLLPSYEALVTDKPESEDIW